MRTFRRRRPRLYADPQPRVALRAETEAELRAIAAEALILQDAAEELLLEIRDRRPLTELARRGGKLTSRFLALRRALPSCDDPALGRCACTLRDVLSHHAYMVSSSLDLLAFDWRSERIAERLDRLGGLGEPARRLEVVWGELRRDGGS
jgi:hypothetical protein